MGDEAFWKAIQEYVSTNLHKLVETGKIHRNFLFLDFFLKIMSFVLFLDYLSNEHHFSYFKNFQEFFRIY